MNVLFVNKDSKNYKKRSEQEARAINEHVNGTYARYQREQRSKSNRHAPVKLSGSRHTDLKAFLVDREDVDDEVFDSPASSNRHSSDRHSSDSSRVQSRHTTPSISCPTMERAQSYAEVSSGLTTEDVSAIKFATEFHVHALGVSEVPGIPANQLWYKWWLGSRHEIHRQETQLALLAWAYSSMTFVHSGSARDRIVKGLEFRGAALQQLQHLMQNLKGRGDYATALDCTLYLGCVEWQHGSFNETMAHFKAANSFLETLGGIKVLPPQSQETLLWIFNNVSFTFSVRPLLQPGDIDGGSRHARDAEGLNSLSRMSLDDRRTPGDAVGQLIGSQLASMLAQTIKVIEIDDGLAKSSVAPNGKVKRFHELYLRKVTLQLSCAHLWHDMLEATPTSTRDHGGRHHSTAPASSFRSTFCLLLRLYQKLSMDAFTSMVPWKKYWIPWHDKILDRIRPIQYDMQSRTAAHERPDREQKARELILLWMFFTGACIEQTFLTAGAREVGSADRVIYCSTQFTNLARQMGYRRAGDVAADIHKYIVFSATKQGQILRKLMQPLEQHGHSGHHRR